MKVDNALLQKSPIFKNIKPEEFGSLFACVGAHRENFKKGEFIFLNGNKITDIGIVLSGHVQIIKEDVYGNRTILSDLRPPQTFGESFCCGSKFILTVSAIALENTSILFLPFERVMHMCPSACGYHNLLIHNMVEMIATKNIGLLEKLEVTTKHSLREKIFTYLSQLSQEQNSTTVTSSLGRVELADFFGADRSSLTRELNKMQKEGLISFNRNTYKLLHYDFSL